MELGISSYSLRNEWTRLAGDKIDALAAVCRDLDVSQVELLDSEFTPETLPGIVARLAGRGITVFGIAVGQHLLVKPGELDTALREAQRIVTMAHAAGVKYIRFFVGDGPMPHAFPPMDDFDDEEWEEYHAQMAQAVDYTAPLLEPLLAHAEPLDVHVGIESHHGYSSNYVYMEKLLARFPSRHLGWIFDVGNFENDALRWKALEAIKRRTFYVHAKAYQFDARGLEPTLDYPRACEVLADAGFAGVWSIEFEGKMNGLHGVHRTAELIKYAMARSAGRDYAINVDVPPGDVLLEKYNAQLQGKPHLTRDAR